MVTVTARSALSPLLFVTVMEALSREFRVTLPWELLYADDLVVTAETEDDLIKRLLRKQRKTLWGLLYFAAPCR